MSVRIRLARHGTRKRPFYRIVVADSGSPRDGRFIERVGLYDPGSSPSRIEFSRDKLVSWLRKGAQPSDTVSQLIKRAGIDHRAPDAGGTASVE
jgi:small subunit ribosomal protein S16